MKHLLFVFTIFFPNLLFSQTPFSKFQKELIGTTIDTIHITDYLQNEPVDKRFDNKFKVLEFWATWCKPCLKAVPHINKLQNQFKDQDIVFLSVTSQRPEETIETLKRVKFESIVISDQTKKLHRKLKVEVGGTLPLPQTVLIDNENKIIWYGPPRKLTAELIRKFLKKEKI